MFLNVFNEDVFLLLLCQAFNFPALRDFLLVVLKLVAILDTFDPPQELFQTLGCFSNFFGFVLMLGLPPKELIVEILCLFGQAFKFIYALKHLIIFLPCCLYGNFLGDLFHPFLKHSLCLFM